MDISGLISLHVCIGWVVTDIWWFHLNGTSRNILSWSAYFTRCMSTEIPPLLIIKCFVLCLQGQDVSFSPKEWPSRAADQLLRWQKPSEQQAAPPPGQQQEEEKCARLYTRGSLQIGLILLASPQISLPFLQRTVTSYFCCQTRGLGDY